MEELKIYETYTRGNVDENEIVPIKIFTHNTIDELTIKQINNMPCYPSEDCVATIGGVTVVKLSNATI